MYNTTFLANSVATNGNVATRILSCFAMRYSTSSSYTRTLFPSSFLLSGNSLGKTQHGYIVRRGVRWPVVSNNNMAKRKKQHDRFFATFCVAQQLTTTAKGTFISKARSIIASVA